MAVSEQYLEYALGQLAAAGLAPLRHRRMFGGVGLYLDETFFALIENDTLRFKVDDGNRPDYEARGMEPFRPWCDRPAVMAYYAVPVEVLEDPDTLAHWARAALAAARRRA